MRGGGGWAHFFQAIIDHFSHRHYSPLSSRLTRHVLLFVCFLVHAGLFDYFDNLPLSDLSVVCLACQYGSSVYTISPEVLLYGIFMPVLNVYRCD